MRQFVAITDTGSFTKAAVRLAVSQPALSASMAKLEEELNVKLLYRTPKAITPTAAGRIFLVAAREVVAACNKVRADVRADIANKPVRMGVLRTLPTPHLARLVESLQVAMPNTAVELCDGTRETLNAQLLDRKVVACITSPGDEHGLNSVELSRESYGLVVGLHHRFAQIESISLEDLREERFIVRTHCEAFSSTTRLLNERGIRTHIVFKTDQDDRALSLVAAGLGVALMPGLFNTPKTRNIRVRDLHTERVIALQWNAGMVDARLNALIAFISSFNWKLRSESAINRCEAVES